MFHRCETRARIGLKGPRAAAWLGAQGITLPPQPNTWAECGSPGAAASLLVMRLGASEYMIEDSTAAGAVAGSGTPLQRLALALQDPPPGIYPVLREDAAFELSGDGSLDVLAQLCSMNFAALEFEARPVIMTLMIGVSVLLVPQPASTGVRYRIWCDPTFAYYLEKSVATVVTECGGNHGRMSA